MRVSIVGRSARLQIGYFSLVCVFALLAGCQAEPGNPAQLRAAEGTLPGRCSLVEMAEYGDKVVSSWATAPSDALITQPLAQMTVRQFVTPHWDGEVIRLRLSNRYASVPVTIENLHIAEQHPAEDGGLIPGSECLLTQNGNARIEIPAGESVLTDAIVFPVRAFQSLGISFFAPEPVLQLTRHLDAVEVPYLSLPGDYANDPGNQAFLSLPTSITNNYLLLEALEVAARSDVGTLVAVGDSITDGSGNLAFTIAGLTGQNPAIGADERYPNFLARRILDAGLPLSVANKGISGNRLLSAGTVPQFGPSLLDRFDVDVLATTGLTHVLVMIGTNDFGNFGPPRPEEVIAGLTQLVEQSHAAGVKITLGTITPAKGAITGTLPAGLSESFGVMHGTPQATASRNIVNDWIRTQEMSDGVVDFYACLEDPDNPGYLNPAFNSGDNLHPNSAGYAAMAECVDLKLFR